MNNRCKICNASTEFLDVDLIEKYGICRKCELSISATNKWDHINRSHHPILTRSFYQWNLCYGDVRPQYISNIAAYFNPNKVFGHTINNHTAYRAWIEPCYLVSIVDIYQTGFFGATDRWEYLMWTTDSHGLTHEIKQDAYFSSCDLALLAAQDFLQELQTP